MRSFKDRNGVDWTVDITIDTVDRVFSSLGISLIDIQSKVVHKPGDPPDPDADTPVLVRLSVDIRILASVLWKIVEDQAADRKIAEPDFRKALRGPNLAEAYAAFWDELSDFIRNLPGKAHLAEAIEKQLALVTMIGERARTKMSSMDLERVGRMVDQIDLDELIRKSGEKSGKPPDESA